MYIVSKWGFDAIPPVTLAFLRVALGAATLLGVVRVVYPSREFSRQDWTGFGFLGVWVAVTMVTQFIGTDLTTASEGALITVLTPIFTLVFGVIILDEALTRGISPAWGLRSVELGSFSLANTNWRRLVSGASLVSFCSWSRVPAGPPTPSGVSH